MVEFTSEGCRISLKECETILDAALWKGSARDRARLARAVHHGIGAQVLHAIRTSTAGGKFEKPSSVAVPIEIIHPVVDSLRPTDADTADNVGSANKFITEYDQKYEDYRREQIIGKFAVR